MSQENVELYRHAMDAWTRGDRSAFLRTVTSEWEFQPSGVFLGLEAVYQGREGASRLWDDMRGAWQDFSVRVERIEDLGEKVVALLTVMATGRDGTETTRRWAHVASYRDGVITVVQNYTSWKGALEAVGLAE
jgi:ketosteroid isomerase-like protein